MPNIYLYAIIDSTLVNKISSPGITNEKPYPINYKDIALIVCETESKRIEIDYENLSKHDDLVYELMKEYCVLPVAFNTIIANKADVNTFLEQNYNQIKINFEKLSGKIEMGLKVIWDINKIKHEISSEKIKKTYFDTTTPAKLFMQKKYSEYSITSQLENMASFIRDEIVKKLLDVCYTYKINLLQSEKIAVNGAFLIDKSKKEEFLSVLEEFKKKYTDLSLLVSGPWAPYNFIELSGEN